MITLLWTTICLAACVVLFSCRTHLVYLIRLQAIRIRFNQVALQCCEHKHTTYEEDLNFLKHPSLLYMIFDIRKWTLKQFYPNLEDE